MKTWKNGHKLRQGYKLVSLPYMTLAMLNVQHNRSNYTEKNNHGSYYKLPL